MVQFSLSVLAQKVHVVTAAVAELVTSQLTGTQCAV